MHAFLDLIRNHLGVVLFGFMLALLSSFGQTYFIALSVPDMQATFGLTHGDVGTVFSLATLASGILMIWIGAALDTFDARKFAAVALAGLALAALALSIAGQWQPAHVVLLGLSIFGLRLFGQGMLAHASVTSTARLPLAIRGRAIGVASLGFQVGVGVFPLVGVAMISSFGWIVQWQISAAVLALSAAAVTATLVRRDPGALPPARPAQSARHKRWTILRDPRFLLIVPAMLGPPAVGTGFFFHQRYLAEFKGWSLELLAISVAVSAVTSAASTVLAGSLVDRFGAARMCRVFLLPLAAAATAFVLVPGTAGAMLFFGLWGLTSGSGNVVITAVLAEIYGVAQIGMIRALAGGLVVLASAVTPGLFGIALDQGIGAPTIALGCVAYLLGATALTARVSTSPDPSSTGLP